MGWMYLTHLHRRQDRHSLVDYVLADLAVIGPILRHTCVGNHLWTVVARPAGAIIGLDLLAFGGADHGWGHKGLCESMHPSFYTCPLAYLDLAPVACEEWRDGVRRYHDDRKRPVDVGATYLVSGSWRCRGTPFDRITIAGARPLTATAHLPVGDVTFRVSPRLRACLVPAPCAA